MLSQIKTLKLTAASLEPKWDGIAEGRVNLSKTSQNVLVFSETGEWNFTEKPKIKFFNIYRWKRFSEDEILELSHLRNGKDNPVHLLNFKKAGEKEWHSQQPHLCHEDIYSAIISVKKDSISLKWKIDGPAKKQTVVCFYQ